MTLKVKKRKTECDKISERDVLAFMGLAAFCTIPIDPDIAKTIAMGEFLITSKKKSTNKIRNDKKP